MHRNLLAYINQYPDSPLTDEETAWVKAAFQPKKLRKKQYFLEEGNVCKYVGLNVNILCSTLL